MQCGWIGSKVGRILQAGAVILVLMGCTAQSRHDSPSSKATPTPLPDEFQAEALEMRTRWRAQDLRRYTITFEFVEDTRKPIVAVREVFIGDGAIRGVRCSTVACPTSIFKDVVTINDVFNFMLRIPQSCIASVQYHPIFYYPSFISADCAEDIPHPFTLTVRRLSYRN